MQKHYSIIAHRCRKISVHFLSVVIEHFPAELQIGKIHLIIKLPLTLAIRG